MAFLAMLSIVQGSVVWAGLVSLVIDWPLDPTSRKPHTCCDSCPSIAPQASGLVVCVLGVTDGSLSVGDTVLFVTMINQVGGWVPRGVRSAGRCSKGARAASIHPAQAL